LKVKIPATFLAPSGRSAAPQKGQEEANAQRALPQLGQGTYDTLTIKPGD
jgi:hypothetical protein